MTLGKDMYVRFYSALFLTLSISLLSFSDFFVEVGFTETTCCVFGLITTSAFCPIKRWLGPPSVRRCKEINFTVMQEENGSDFDDLLAAGIASIPAREDRQ